MTFKERNCLIKDLINDYLNIHNEFTSCTRILTDSEWEQYINTIDQKRSQFKGTGLYAFADYVGQAFLNDTEYVQKELKKL